MKQKKMVSLLLAAILVGSAALGGCGSSQKPNASEGCSTAASGDEKVTASGSNAEEQDAEVPKDDPEKRYEISYTGYWCDSTYEPDNYVETMIENALNIDINVEKAETSETIDLLLSSIRCRTACGSTSR